MTDLTEQQRANLTQLAAYLRTLPADYPDFEMRRYVDSATGYGDCAARLPECGTAACAAGHGPAAGIPPLEDETWSQYSRRAFVPECLSPEDHAWQWCFSANWARIDNSAHGAAARIEWLLAHGVPGNAAEQRYGKAPLYYSAALLAAPRAGEGE